MIVLKFAGLSVHKNHRERTSVTKAEGKCWSMSCIYLRRVPVLPRTVYIPHKPQFSICLGFLDLELCINGRWVRDGSVILWHWTYLGKFPKGISKSSLNTIALVWCDTRREMILETIPFPFWALYQWPDWQMSPEKDLVLIFLNPFWCATLS